MRPIRPIGVAALVMSALLAVGCAGQSVVPSSPSATGPSSPASIPTPSTDPGEASGSPSTSTPIGSPGQDASVLHKDSIAEVVTDGLRVRTNPRVADDSRKLEPLLARHVQVFVTAGPTRASGYDWYLVRPLDAGFPAGWVAAADHDGTPWLRPAVIDCPAKPSLVQLGTMDRHVALACYGARTFDLTGILTSPIASCDTSWSIDPWWLDGCNAAHHLATDKGHGDPGMDGTPTIEIRIPPDLEGGADIPDVPYGLLLPVRVTGHFDDPVATTCRPPKGSNTADGPPAAIILLDCRAAFVVSAIKVLPDPDAIPMPKPVIASAGWQWYSFDSGDSGMRFMFDVTNRGSYPAALFESRSDLPSCGASGSAPRTWVTLWDAEGSVDLQTFCSLHDPSDLKGIWFAVPTGGEPPAGGIYIVLTDRLTGTQVRSDTVPLAFPSPTSSP